MRRNARPGPVLLAFIAVATTLSLPSAAAAAAKISGRVTGVNGHAKAAGLRPTVRLVRLSPAYQSRTIMLPAAGGSFSARVPAGVWAVSTTTYRGGRASGKVRLYKATKRKSVAIGSGRTVRVAARRYPRPAAGVPVVSVAPIDVAGLGDVSGLLINDIFQGVDKGPCKIHVVEDRSSPFFSAIMAEARLRASRYIDRADYRSMTESMAILRAWKPKFRVTGSLSMDAGENISGKLRLVDLKTGKVIAERTVAQGSDFVAESEAFGREVGAALCKFPPRLRLAISSNDTLVLGPGATIASTWNGTFDFPLQALSKSGATYLVNVRAIGAWSAAVTADTCSGTLTWSGIADRGDGSVTLKRRADGSLTYFVSFAWLRSTLVDGVPQSAPMTRRRLSYSMGASAPVVISERATPKLPAQGSGPIGPRMYGGAPMQATWTLSAPVS